jgi:hypothetical protein
MIRQPDPRRDSLAPHELGSQAPNFPADNRRTFPAS